MSKKCLSCHIQSTDQELTEGYHPKCSRRLFGTVSPPKIPFGSGDIIREAYRMVGRMSISGVQPKLSVIHESRKRLLTVVDRGGLYILKPPTERFEELPENENLCMNIAVDYGIEIPPHGLLPLLDNRLAYVVKRFDRLEDGSKLQQEDFQQLLQTDDKYSGSYERIADFVKRYSAVPGLDLIRLFERVLLFFVLANGDAHLKNYSLLRREKVGYEFSPAYDIMNSRVVLPEEQEEMCLSVRGKKNRLSRKDFIDFAEHIGLTSKQSENSLERLQALGPRIEDMISESFLRTDFKEGFLKTLRGRMDRLYR